MSKQTFYLIAYDLPAQNRRHRLAKTLENWGKRVQYSVFEALLTPAQLQTVCQQISQVISEADHVRIYALCGTCLHKTIIWGPEPVALQPDHFLV